MHGKTPNEVIEVTPSTDSDEKLVVLDGKAPDEDGRQTWFRIYTATAEESKTSLVDLAGEIANQTSTFNGKNLNIQEVNTPNKIEMIEHAALPDQEIEAINEAIETVI